MSESHTTTDHNKIKKWVDERGGGARDRQRNRKGRARRHSPHRFRPKGRRPGRDRLGRILQEIRRSAPAILVSGQNQGRKAQPLPQVRVWGQNLVALINGSIDLEKASARAGLFSFAA